MSHNLCARRTHKQQQQQHTQINKQVASPNATTQTKTTITTTTTTTTHNAYETHCNRTVRSSRYIVFDRKSMPIVACASNARRRVTHRFVCRSEIAQCDSGPPRAAQHDRRDAVCAPFTWYVLSKVSYMKRVIMPVCRLCEEARRAHTNTRRPQRVSRSSHSRNDIASHSKRRTCFSHRLVAEKH